jgi:flagellar biosynthesis/type III secretory pathway chaperone
MAQTAFSLLTALVQSLHEESDALVAGDADRLASIANRKHRLLQQLAPLVPGAAPNWPRELVQKAKNLNDRNALLLAPRLTATRARVDAIRQAGGQTLYGADGRCRALASA